MRAADQGVADALESLLSDHTRRVYAAQWRLFVEWCDSVGLRSLLTEPFTVARYMAARANSGASIATCGSPPAPLPRRTSGRGSNRRVRDQGVRAALKGWGRAPFEAPAPGRRPHRRQPRKRGRGFETAEQSEERGRFDLALVVVLSDAGLRRSEAAALTWGDVQRWDDGSGRRITVIRSKTDVEAQGRRGGHHARRHEGLWTPSGRRALVAR